MSKLELLSPAGDFERLRMAVAYGADSVYLAGTAFGMRAFAGISPPKSCPRLWSSPTATASACMSQ